MADNLGADLDQLLLEAGSDQGSAALGIASVRIKLPRLIGERGQNHRFIRDIQV
jgi:hypothetical protein